MERHEQILKEIAFLELRLQSLKLELEFVRSSGSEQKGKIEPFRPNSECSATPMQTAIGKESSNPLMAISLPKAEKKHSKASEVPSPHKTVKEFSEIPKDFLRPNQGIQIPKKNEDHSSSSSKEEKGIQNPKKDFYVVYNGPYAGIYDHWGTAKKATNKIPGVSYKKFKDMLSARTSADIYTNAQFGEKLKYIPGATTSPKSFAEALTTRPSNMKSLGKPKFIKIEEDDDVGFNPEFDLKSFLYIYKYGRNLEEEHFLTDRAFTIDKKEISYLNFVNNSDPEGILESFKAGLVRFIYPSTNLQELRLLPKVLKSSVQRFRKKCIKDSEKEIFLKIKSTIPCWEDYYNGLDDSVSYRPNYLVQIGISKGVNYQPSQKMEAVVLKEQWQGIAEEKAIEFFQAIEDILSNEKIFIIYCDDRILIYSSSPKERTKEDLMAILNFQSEVSSCKLLGFHSDKICSYLNKKASVGKPYSCPQKGKAVITSGPSFSVEDTLSDTE
ncbi:unnamed protein product [Carnation etched ring virus]|uniref:Transactivator/viroplasmin protein n=1 Tax=Carnation etched ring virus TaxID=10640 RepID=IBMP_CERV|nr:Inclusion body matrix protein [Carnation etched ring virus]P05401.1 RecName: Full=Transactivator/viroplasmin protein; Short=Tav; AltName: Full=Inclusion body matrix protein [Carnation etched ring virus]CAA28361.1 unnamed protein product [Carnation etched ring virus]prf//1301227F ORF 6 [Carnation etched ring virus]